MGGAERCGSRTPERLRSFISEGLMHLDLSDADARTLHDLLSDILPDLRREVAATDARDMKHALVQRQEVCERLITMLERGQAAG